MEPTTIIQLDEWMTANCYNDSYGIGNRNIHEGYGLDIFGSLYVWYYTERGQRDNLKYFRTEKEAVAYALEQMRADKFANAHLVGFIRDKESERELLSALQQRGVYYWKDKIPYGSINDLRTRVFVSGCDVKKVLDLQKQFGFTR